MQVTANGIGPRDQVELGMVGTELHLCSPAKAGLKAPGGG
jgi:hypothetical protein